MRENFGGAIFFVWMIIFCCWSCRLPDVGLDKPPNTFKESDLVGTWQAKYGVERIDTITLKADGTYQQIYRQLDGYSYESPWNKWYVEYRPTGWIYVHLEGMRYYVDGIELGERGGRRSTGESELFYFYRQEDKVVDMVDKVILKVGRFDHAPRGIDLVQMKIDPDSAGHFFTLCLKCGQETPTAQEEGLQCCQKGFEPVVISNCWNLSLTEGYRLQIIRYEDGAQWTHLEDADGNQVFADIQGITWYAMEGNVMVGEIGRSHQGNWFWVNFSTRDSARIYNESEYLAALKKLGFAERPELHPVEFYCEKGDCRPCFGWAPPKSTITPTLSPSLTATATLTTTP